MSGRRRPAADECHNLREAEEGGFDDDCFCPPGGAISAPRRPYGESPAFPDAPSSAETASAALRKASLLRASVVLSVLCGSVGSTAWAQNGARARVGNYDYYVKLR